MLPPSSCCEQRCSGHGYTSAQVPTFNSFGRISKSGIAGLYGNSMFKFRGTTILFSVTAAQFHIPTSKANGFQLLHIFTNFFFFFWCNSHHNGCEVVLVLLSLPVGVSMLLFSLAPSTRYRKQNNTGELNAVSFFGSQGPTWSAFFTVPFRESCSSSFFFLFFLLLLLLF